MAKLITSTSNEMPKRKSRESIGVVDVVKRLPHTSPVTKLVDDGTDPGKSKAYNEDPFMSVSDSVLTPPIDLLAMTMTPEQNSELGQVIEAMETNIEGFGHMLVPRIEEDAVVVEETKLAIKREFVMLTNFFNYANLRMSFPRLRRAVRKDMESTGGGFIEVIKTVGGTITGFTHLPAYQMRLTKTEQDSFLVSMPTLQMGEDGNYTVAQVRVYEKFRRFVQSSVAPFQSSVSQRGSRLRWFKEFGDPRTYDNESGELVKDEELLNWARTGKPMPEDRKANEVAHFKLYASRTPYGLPRYLGNSLSIAGDRMAEETNYNTLSNNNIPSMMLLVSNGQLTDSSVARIKDFAEKIGAGQNFSRFLLLEAEGVLEGDEAGTAKIEAKQLVDSQHKDALFQKYSQNNQDKIRRAYRLPPIFVGRSDDYTRATADTSRRLADEQVFAPERDEFDWWVN